MSQKTNLDTLKKGDRFKLFETDNFNYIVLDNYKSYVRYKVESDCRPVMSHHKSGPACMVTVFKK